MTIGNLRDPKSEIRDSELIPLLSEMDPRGGVASVTVEEKRRNYLSAVTRSGPPEEVASTSDETVGDIKVRVYRPKLTQTERAPVVLYLHGGGFISGSLETHDPVCRMLSNHVPALVAAVDYRLAPENPYPAALEDCFAALTWLAANASSMGGDPARISVVGDSAGGNLAAAIALLARDRGGAPLASQVLIYPMLDATLSSASLVENAFIPPFTLVDCVYCWQLYLNPADDRRSPYISPLQASSLAGLPPALVLTAECDILADEGAAYAARLRDAGIAVEHEHFDGMIHGFFQWGGVLAAARLAMHRVAQYLSIREHTA